ncbi:MAG: TerC family protein [Planctomycetota bacterium]|nr:TerC family protein [Planctomycetota bacterium]
MDGWWPWVAFNVFVLAMLAVDLGLFHRRSHEVSLREALTWSAVWVALALLFNAGLWRFHPGGTETAMAFLAGYAIEKSLSVDNLFVILLLFSYFRVPKEYQHRVLFWGILGALAMRAALIVAGVALIQRFHWMFYLFGAILLISGVKLWFEKEKKVDPSQNPVLRFFRRIMPMTERMHGESFFVREDGKRKATPLFLSLVMVETTDLIFAVDSVPAIIAVTPDPFIVYTSNAFAILGLRSLYFALAGIMKHFHTLHYGLSAILVFVGGKMILADYVKIPVAASLGVVLGLLALSIAAAFVWPAPARAEDAEAAESATASTPENS